MSKLIATFLFISSFCICEFACDDPLTILPLNEYFRQHPGESRIINGIPAESGQFPWQVFIRGNISTTQDLACGGSIINETKILTAAHCVFYPNVHYRIYLGGLTWGENAEAGRIIRTSTNYYAHPDFNPETLENDVGIILLDPPLNFTTNIRPVELPVPGMNVVGGAIVQVSGWGATADNTNTISSVLRWVNLTTINNSQCQIHFGDAITSSTLCAVGDLFQSTCSGDSGGALVRMGENGTVTQVGVVSFVSISGCSLGLPSGYVRTESMLDFINSANGISVNRVFLMAIVLGLLLR